MWVPSHKRSKHTTHVNTFTGKQHADHTCDCFHTKTTNMLHTLLVHMWMPSNKNNHTHTHTHTKTYTCTHQNKQNTHTHTQWQPHTCNTFYTCVCLHRRAATPFAGVLEWCLCSALSHVLHPVILCWKKIKHHSEVSGCQWSLYIFHTHGQG